MVQKRKHGNKKKKQQKKKKKKRATASKVRRERTTMERILQNEVQVSKANEATESYI